MLITNREYLDTLLSSIVKQSCHVEGYNRKHMYYRVKGFRKLCHIETKKVIPDIDKEE